MGVCTQMDGNEYKAAPINPLKPPFPTEVRPPLGLAAVAWAALPKTVLLVEVPQADLIVQVGKFGRAANEVCIS